MSISYADAGVNIDAGNEAVEKIKSAVQATHSPAVLTDLGGFGGAIDVKKILEDYKNPVLVQSTDSVGTKVMVASMMNKYESIGRDLVGNVVGDILVMGAKPLTFLDYLANDVTKPEVIEEIVTGIAAECTESGMSLIGGEIAEMPGVYQKNEIDVVGFVTGVVERDQIITGKEIVPGDVVLGIASNGLLTNGFSLARKIFFDVGGHTVTDTVDELGQTVGEALLTPHLNYTKPIRAVLDAGVPVHGMAHITGGGLVENIPRILPDGCAAELDKTSWPRLPIFDVMQRIGDVEEEEMCRTFNMGIGIVVVVSKDNVDAVREKVKSVGFTMYEVGRITEGSPSVILN